MCNSQVLDPCGQLDPQTMREAAIAAIDWPRLLRWQRTQAGRWHMRQGQYYPVEEYESAGNLGIARACRSWRPAAGCTLLSWMLSHILWAMADVPRTSEHRRRGTRRITPVLLPLDTVPLALAVTVPYEALCDLLRQWPRLTALEQAALLGVSTRTPSTERVSRHWARQKLRTPRHRRLR